MTGSGGIYCGGRGGMSGRGSPGAGVPVTNTSSPGPRGFPSPPWFHLCYYDRTLPIGIHKVFFLECYSYGLCVLYNILNNVF